MQFETIHPFLDGDGRSGRLLITALLEDSHVIDEPLMYPSGFFKQHQAEYYRRLNAVRSEGDWEGWLRFFLEGMASSARAAEQLMIDLAKMIHTQRRHTLAQERVSQAAMRLFELLPGIPRLTVGRVRKVLKTSFPTANSVIHILIQAGILIEVTGRRKNRTFRYEAYVQRLSR